MVNFRREASTQVPWNNDLKITVYQNHVLELEIECMEINYFIPGDDSHTITLTIFIKKASFFIKLFVIRLEEIEDNM